MLNMKLVFNDRGPQLFDILLVDSDKGMSAAAVTPPPSSRASSQQPPCCIDQPRAVHRSFCPPGFESRVQNHVRQPLLTSTLCPDHGTSERSCTHPACAACGPSTNASHPHRPSPDGAASAPPARAHPCAALLRSRGCCTRLRCGLATPGIVGDLHRRDLYVRDGVVATLPCTSCISSARRRELVAAGR